MVSGKRLQRTGYRYNRLWTLDFRADAETFLCSSIFRAIGQVGRHFVGLWGGLRSFLARGERREESEGRGGPKGDGVREIALFQPTSSVRKGHFDIKAHFT